MHHSVLLGFILSKTVIVAYNAYQLAAGNADYIIRYCFFNALCKETELRAFLPDVIAGEYTVTGYHHYLVRVVGVDSHRTAPVHRCGRDPLYSAVTHLHLFVEKRPVLAAVRSNIEFITELTVWLRNIYVLRAGNHSVGICRIDNYIAI